jgi:hypothetical protein
LYGYISLENLTSSTSARITAASCYDDVTNPKQALELLGKFPFGQAGLMEFQVIPLGATAPLRVLLTDRKKGRDGAHQAAGSFEINVASGRPDCADIVEKLRN